MTAALPASTATGEDAESVVLDQVFGALADPVRRALLTALDGQDRLVSELAAPFDISLQAVSRHIQVLVRAGLVTQQRTGRISRCRLDAGPIFAAAIWVNRYSKYWQSQFDTLAAWLDRISTEQDEEGSDAVPRNDREAHRLPQGNRRAARKDAGAPGRHRTAKNRGLPVRDD